MNVTAEAVATYRAYASRLFDEASRLEKDARPLTAKVVRRQALRCLGAANAELTDPEPGPPQCRKHEPSGACCPELSWGRHA